MPEQLASLIATLLEGHFQPTRRDVTWKATVAKLRQEIRHQLALSPSLGAMFYDPDWLTEIWSDALAQAADETGCGTLPVSCPWSIEEVLANNGLQSPV
jgi:hypothetical protein